MSGALASMRGVLYVARPGARAHVQPFDFDGRPLSAGFRVRGLDGARVDPRALAVDEDRRLWLADTSSAAVRGFDVFGQERFQARDEAGRARDAAGSLGRPVGVAASGVERETRLLVASSGERRHALHLLDPHERLALSLRPLGDPQGRFRGLAGVALRAGLGAVCERAAQRVQVFREGEFHFAFRCPPAPGVGEDFDPVAVAILAGGRFLVVHAGERPALLLFDAGGRFERTVARHGAQELELVEPCSVALEEVAGEPPRLAVLDQAGLRVQVLTLDGRAYGSFLDTTQASV